MTTIDTQATLDGKIKGVCDLLRRSKCQGASQYVPEISWLLFLRFLDEREISESRDAKILGNPFQPSLRGRYRWSSWAAPEGKHRRKLQDGRSGDVFHFLEEDLLPLLKRIGRRAKATMRQQLISQIVADVDKTRVDTERHFLDVVDKIDDIRLGNIDEQHLFALSAAYEGLLLSMGEANSDSGQFYTPREVVRAMVRTVEPKVGDKVYDPCCGTGGFLAQAYEHMREGRPRRPLLAEELEQLAQQTFYGREKDNLAYPIALANLVLHGIDYPRIWHGNTLTGTADYTQLFEGAPANFNVILTNPPFGGKEGADARSGFAYKTSATSVLFLQHVIDALDEGGRCGMVVDEGLLFGNETAFVQTKRKLLEECDLHCIVSLAPGVFTTAGSGVKTNILFFRKGKPTKAIWYYEVLPEGRERFTKTAPVTLRHFDGFFKLLKRRADSEHSWTVSIDEIKERNYDLKAVNPHRKGDVDTRTPADLLAEIERHNVELKKALADLRRTLRPPTKRRSKKPASRGRARPR